MDDDRAFSRRWMKCLCMCDRRLRREHENVTVALAEIRQQFGTACQTSILKIWRLQVAVG